MAERIKLPPPIEINPKNPTPQIVYTSDHWILPKSRADGASIRLAQGDDRGPAYGISPGSD
jgi:hypothetical protein